MSDAGVPERGETGLGVTLAVIAAGGAAGTLARYAVGAAFPQPPGAFAWPTLAVNASGCLLIGVLMAVVSGLRTPRPLLRPFLGVGVLGGFTTFSTYVLDAQRSLAAGAPATALAYLVVTLVAALTAVSLGDWLGRPLGPRSRRGEGAP